MKKPDVKAEGRKQSALTPAHELAVAVVDRLAAAQTKRPARLLMARPTTAATMRNSGPMKRFVLFIQTS